MTDDKDNPLGNVKAQLEESEQETTSQDQDKDDVDEEKDEEHGPPFPFSETHQRPLYPHEDSWEDWEDAKYEAEGILRKHGVRDPHGREFDDALIQLGVQNPDALAELVLEARGLDPREED